MPMCCCYLRATRFRILRRDKCAPCCGNTGSRRRTKSTHKACGGEDNSSGSTLPRLNANLMEGLLSWNGQLQWNRENEWIWCSECKSSTLLVNAQPKT